MFFMNICIMCATFSQRGAVIMCSACGGSSSPYPDIWHLSSQTAGRVTAGAGSSLFRPAAFSSPPFWISSSLFFGSWSFWISQYFHFINMFLKLACTYITYTYSSASFRNKALLRFQNAAPNPPSFKVSGWLWCNLKHVRTYTHLHYMGQCTSGNIHVLTLNIYLEAEALSLIIESLCQRSLTFTSYVKPQGYSCNRHTIIYSLHRFYGSFLCVQVLGI